MKRIITKKEIKQWGKAIKKAAESLAKEHKLHRYEVLIAASETWVFEVDAASKEDAIARVKAGEGDQTCSLAGWPNGKDKTIARRL